MSRPGDPADTYRRDRVSPRERFDEVETTISHLFRRPHPALGGRSFGGALHHALDAKGLLAAGQVMELGGGAGFVAAALTEAADRVGRPLRYTFVELSPTLARLQRQAVPHASVVRAHAERLPFADRSVPGLFLANEVIADLRVDRGEEAASLARAHRLDVGPGELVNVGALRLVEELARVLAPGASACLTEFGTEGPASPVRLHGALGAGDHVEHSIRIPFLERAAEHLGLEVERVPLARLLEVDLSARVASYPDVLRLRRLVPRLPVLAHPKEELERRHPLLTRFFRFELPAIGSPRFPDPSATAGFAQLFFALLLHRRSPASS